MAVGKIELREDSPGDPATAAFLCEASALAYLGEEAGTKAFREQLGLALNRAGRGEEAERVLTDLIAARGPSSETHGILGRVYKDRWQIELLFKAC